MKPTDDERLRHLLDALREATSLLQSATSDVHADRTLALALTKLIEIAGEAAANVSPSRRSELPTIPWDKLVATRNRLIHGYYDVNTSIVIQTVREDFPALVAALEGVIKRS